MPVETRVGRQIATALARRVGDDATAAQIAEAMVAIWHDIDGALTPIIGGGASPHSTSGRSTSRGRRTLGWC